jgi:hypothetical protein
MRFILIVMLVVLPCTHSMADALSDTRLDELQTQAAGEQARNGFQKAQALKLENRFNEARAQFDSIAALKEPGTETWADLATDELDYGLLLHEANYWVLKLGSGATDGKVLKTYQANAEGLYRQILELNSHKPERMRDIQQRLDQLYVTGQAINQSANVQAMSQLLRLGKYMDTYFQDRGEWPDQTDLAAELRETLKLARLSTKRFLIRNYWRNTNDYYALLMDTEGGPDIKLTGDAQGSRLERVQP